MAVTITETRTGTIKKITFDWVSSTGGAASGTTTFPYDGQALLLQTVPSTSAAPTAAYTVAVTDVNGLDVLTAGGSTGRSATATEYTRSTPSSCAEATR